MTSDREKFIRELSTHFELSDIHQWWRILQEDLFNENRVLCIDSIIQSIKEGRPIQQIVGKAYFYDRHFYINEYVLIPRPETEELIQWILDSHGEPSLTVQEWGVGSGCISIILKSQRPHWNIKGYDLSTQALAIAQLNSEAYHLAIDWHIGDMIQSKYYDSSVDIIVSNPPYVLQSEWDHLVSKTVKDYEPKMALVVPDEDPLRYYDFLLRHGADAAQNRLNVYFEIHHQMADRLLEIADQIGYQQCEVRKDLQGKDRLFKAILDPSH